MPEGVECLVVAEDLKKWIISNSISNRPKLYLKEIIDPVSIRNSPIDMRMFNDLFSEINIDRISTFGKNIFIPSYSGYCLVIQLGMTGTLTEERNKYSRINFSIKYKNKDIDLDLYYNDIRKFGNIMLLKKDNFPRNIENLMKNSIEWRNKEAPELFAKRVKYRKKWKFAEIKSVLLNQQLIAGIGNIYACEALFDCGIHPQTLVYRLNKDELEKIIHSVQNIMNESYKLGGMTVNNFQSFGKPGFGKKNLKVYGRRGLPCNKCQGAVIQKVMIKDRGTFYCPICQKEKVINGKEKD